MASSLRLVLRSSATFIILVGLASSSPGARVATFQDGLVLYRHFHLEEARVAWEEALSQDPTDGRILAYLADTYRRLGRGERAGEYANRALKQDTCDTHALGVLSDLHNPHFGASDDGSFDQMQHYLTRAIACDSSDGNLWFGVYVSATREADLPMERTALRWIHKSGILTPAVRAYARWTLQDLPRNSILLTNGDMDTYPERVLQEVEAFRSDVGVINVSLLEDVDYAKTMASRFGLSFVDKTEVPPSDSAEAELSSAWRLIRDWLSDSKAKRFKRPIAIASTVELSLSPLDPRLRHEDWDRMHYAGPFYYCLPGNEAVEDADTSRLRSSLQQVPMAVFRGPWTDERDTSPVRHSSTSKLRYNVVTVGLIYGSELLRSGQGAAFQAVADYLKRYVSETRMDIDPATLDSTFDRMRSVIETEDAMRKGR